MTGIRLPNRSADPRTTSRSGGRVARTGPAVTRRSRVTDWTGTPPSSGLTGWQDEEEDNG